MKNLLLRLAGWLAGWLPAGFVQSIYRQKALAGLLRGALNVAAPQGLSEVRVAGGALKGVRMQLDLQAEKDYWLGSYETGLQAASRDWIRPGMVIYDAGANIGYTSILMARQTGQAGKVFAFEALPANLERLRANLELNGLQDRVTVIPAAVVEAVGQVEFLVSRSGGMGKASGSAGRQEPLYTGSIQVDGIALDEFVFQQGQPPPDLVKLDIEGGEVLALPGMERILGDCRPIIFLELHGPAAAQLAWEMLTGNAYRLCRMERGYAQLTSLEQLNWKAYILATPPGETPR